MHTIVRIARWFAAKSYVFCPKAGRPASHGVAARALAPLTGVAALVWFLARVVPKPARAAYPCQRVAAPIASGFVLWLMGIGASAGLLRHARVRFRRSQYALFGVALLGAGAVAVHATTQTAALALAVPAPLPAPIGIARGIHPGRVTWAHDPSATNEATQDVAGDYWYDEKNTNQAAVDTMVSRSLQQLTGESTDAASWNALFRHYNKTKRNVDAGYQAGEEVVIKVNLSSAFGMSKSSYTKGSYANPNVSGANVLGMPDTSPQIMRAVLEQLTTAAGVPQNMIYIGDPHKPFFDQYFNMIQPQFPQVKYVDYWGTSGRTKAVSTAADVLFYSDRGTPGSAGSDKIPQIFVDAEYLINLSVLKAHECAGFTATAKNHFGSQARPSQWNADQGYAYHLHYTLPLAANPPSVVRAGYGKYRALVDLMGHKDIGGKTMLLVLDALWSGFTSTPDKPNKWKSAPFNGDYPSSILMSQDMVAIDAVALDFLKEEYSAANGYGADHQYPNTADGVDDHLFQAADPTTWPTTLGTTPFAGYDPEKDGTVIGSLGAFERWNSAQNKQYSRNIDPVAGKGIELLKVALSGGSPDAGAAADSSAPEAGSGGNAGLAAGGAGGGAGNGVFGGAAGAGGGASGSGGAAIGAGGAVAGAGGTVAGAGGATIGAGGATAGAAPGDTAIPGDSNGCSCSTTGRDASTWPFAAAAIGAVLARRRRQRPSRRIPATG